MKILGIFVVFLLAFVASAQEKPFTTPIPPGGIFPNSDHSEVEKILKQNQHLQKNEQGESESGLT
jgi:hypothetical protein